MAINKEKVQIIMLSVITIALVIVAVCSVISVTQQNNIDNSGSMDYKSLGKDLTIHGGTVYLSDGKYVNITKGQPIDITDTYYIYHYTSESGYTQEDVIIPYNEITHILIKERI